MARFFFDWHEQGQTVADEVGVDYPDVDVVRREVRRALMERAADLFSTYPVHQIGITVRDGQGEPILRSYAWISEPGQSGDAGAASVSLN